MNKILVVNLMYIGDLLFATPFLRSLRQHYPEVQISLLVDEKNADVVRFNPNISEIIFIDKKGYHGKIQNFSRLIGNLRRRNYDLVINLHRNERSSALAAFSGGKRIIGFSKPGFSLFFDKVVEERKDIHQAQAYLEILKSVDIPIVDCGLEMWVDEKSTQAAAAMWQQAFRQADGSYPVIGLNTGGSWPTKRWTADGFAQLADQLLDKGYGVCFFGGSMDRQDVDVILQKVERVASPRIAIFTGKTTLLEMAALVKKCAVVVTGDSGPMHIAVSQRVPVITLFGPSDPVRYAPYQQQDAVILSARDCLRCGLHECQGHECMKEIGVDEVLKKISEKLTKNH
ncbi:lipopolysaccharide heptosyltransferase II [Sporomusaceae bacterium BoRhaA]|uniref:lipopolysaccharide heptosyltransferase II n=1 Tax=Pelorhabdus rhamnosifermentans TaxID=2772457 RepID=UPI001C064256|nr:lipopolysaccharide heptosyltransferase II [Pelorhabdus rhamnosifermentans]MBU2699030.1 lipopolysaccharide heptosyltransferase II [Pelorhabdus rhamnosifermentans]